MPNWNGLGYQQLAQTRLSQKADRSQQGWMKFVDTMNKYFETQGAQQYELNQKLPLQQQYNKEIQGMSDTSALERIRLDIEGAGARQTESLKANADLRAKYDLTTGQQLGENALDRANQLAAQGQGKTPDAVDVVKNFISSLIGAGKIPKDATGGPDFGALMNNKELLAEVTRRFDSYLKYSAYTGDPAMAKQWLSEYLSIGSVSGIPQNDKNPPMTDEQATDLANKIGISLPIASVLSGPLAAAIGMISITPYALPAAVVASVMAIINREKISDKIPALRQWLNEKFNGAGDKIFRQTSAPVATPTPTYPQSRGTNAATTPAYPQGRGTKP
jgi:hypothetical protein